MTIVCFVAVGLAVIGLMFQRIDRANDWIDPLEARVRALEGK